MLNSQQKTIFLKNFESNIFTFYSNLYLKSLENQNLTKNTTTRITNLLENSLKLNSMTSSSSFSDQIFKYIDLLSIAEKHKDLKIIEVNNPMFPSFYRFYIGHNFSHVDNNLTDASIVENIDWNNIDNIEKLRNSFLLGLSPNINYENINPEYLTILSKVITNLSKSVSQILNGINVSNFFVKMNEMFNSDQRYKKIEILPYEFFSNFFADYSLSYLHHLHFEQFATIKSFPFEKNYLDFCTNISSTVLKESNFFPSIDKKVVSLYLTFYNYFLKSIKEEELHSILFTPKFLKLISHIKSITTTGTTNNSIELTQNIINKYALKMKDILDPQDSYVSNILLQLNLNNNEFEKKFLNKYQNFSNNELFDILKNIGFNKGETQKMLSFISSQKFNNSNDFEFESITDINIYGFSMSKTDFMRPLQGLSWTDIKYFLNYANTQDFFFNLQNDRLTIGLYTSHDMNFNRNLFAKTIVGTILDLKKQIDNRRNTPNHSDSVISPDEIQKTFNSSIREFILNSVVKDIKNNEQITHTRKKI